MSARLRERQEVWARNRLVRELQRLSAKSFRNCSAGVPCYGVPFIEESIQQKTNEELASEANRLRQALKRHHA